MKSMYKAAASGNRDAMQGLYNQYRRQLYFTALVLLRDKKLAAGASAAAFRRILRDLPAAGVETEEQFENYMMIKLAEHCRTKLGQTDLQTDREDEIQKTDALLSGYSGAERAVLALNTAGELGAVHIARSLKMDLKRVRGILETDSETVQKLLRAAGEEAYEIRVPAWVDERAKEAVEAIAAPVEKRQKARKRALLIAAAAVAVLIAAVLLVTVFGGNGTRGSDAGEIFADIVIRDYGTVTVMLVPEAAPLTVENFVSLAESGFYDGLTFHRIMEGFMMQGGDPNGNGSGGSETNVAGEFALNGWDNPISHTRGVISMARAKPYDSASSQFFICHEDSTFLDGQYAAFGYVTEGIEIVDAVCGDAKPTDDNGTIPPAQQPVIEQIIIRQYFVD